MFSNQNKDSRDNADNQELMILLLKIV